MNQLDWKKSFKPYLMALKATGLWPSGDGTYQLNFYTIYLVVGILLFHIAFISTQSINLYFILDDLKAVTGTIFVLLTDISASLKAYSLIKNMKLLKEVMSTINSDLFQPKSTQQKIMVQPNITAWRTVMGIIWLLTIGCLVLWSLYPIVDESYKQYRLPFLAWFPYNTRKWPQYQMTYIFQVVGITFLATANVGLDALISYLNMFIGAQFDILCDKLRYVFNDSDDRIDKSLMSCVQHHRKILRFAENANQFYNLLLFVQFFVMAISIGLAMFQLTVVVPLTSEFFSLVFYASVISTEVFLYCWFGNEIEVKSSKLPYAIFETEWTSLPPNVKKNMIIFVFQIQKSLTVSAFGLFTLSLQNYLKIMKTAWSYFALLRQVNGMK